MFWQAVVSLSLLYSISCFGSTISQYKPYHFDYDRLDSHSENWLTYKNIYRSAHREAAAKYI